MIMDIVINALCAFVGTLAFSILFNVQRRYYVYCGLAGMLCWLCYYFMDDMVGASLATFIATMLVVLCSRIFAVWRKCPITVFLISGIFPVIPGAKVYYTAYYIVTNDLRQALDNGILALKLAFAIVLGIVFIVSIPRQYFSVEYWRERTRKKKVVS